MSNFTEIARTPNAFNRKAPGQNLALGPLETLTKGNTWVGDTGYNLMVVPSPLSKHNNGFIVLISQLFETDSFDEVPAPVPNRSRDNGTAQVGAVKYSQIVAEKISKNILHEETGMWLNQTLGTNKCTDPRNGLEAIHGTLDGLSASSYMTTDPIIRSGTIPHGNTFQAAGVCNHYSFPHSGHSGDISPYLSLNNFNTSGNHTLPFLPTFKDGSDPSELQKAYLTEIGDAIKQLKSPNNLKVDDFTNPIGFLNNYATNIISLDSLAISTADDLGMVLNVPFARAVAGPQDFVCTFLVETIVNEDVTPPTTDQQATYFQIQYLQSIPLLFPKGYHGKDVLFPHWNVNTLIAI